MTQKLVAILSIALFSSYIYGHTFEIHDGIQELDTPTTIEDLSVFNNSCVDYILINDAQNDEFKLYTANGIDYMFNGSTFNELEVGQKFIIKASGSCNIEVEDIITHNELSYKTVTSPYTGRVWLDRNIGATEACSTSMDQSNTRCFGDYYQWGRGTDGHESDIASTTTVKQTSITNTNRYFVKGSLDWVTVDSGGALRSAQWSKTNGSSVCPVGYRVPTHDEFIAERSANNYSFPTDNFLKLPVPGVKTWHDGTLTNVSYEGKLWTSTPNGSSAYVASYLYNSSSIGIYSTDGISRGNSVRCIKD
ncbi:hypothetical protein FJR48_11680 [Sulfurimonas lithotrophica]|uniref:Fibrobacter succinogenes major paralogous domain-containing protein n=1 Tax=Sulfurimonas lithotrophica TaxID=2590022 RepID=A0A5P8P3T2_9BACT|nr:hypothetical protein [Sulfurimonas lithotrophica]QFR50349.1 hypothetical protein FJR48_11680 [Sulfurimonas lithotrophica]